MNMKYVGLDVFYFMVIAGWLLLFYDQIYSVLDLWFYVFIPVVSYAVAVVVRKKESMEAG